MSGHLQVAPSKLLSGDEYMQLLQARADQWVADHPPSVDARISPRAWATRPLLNWFVRDGDEDLVDPAILARPTPQPKPAQAPRYYRPASYWRERVARIEAQIAPLVEPLLPDRAAAGGEAIGRRGTARVHAREDSRLRRYVDLGKRLSHARSMLRAAELREEASPLRADVGPRSGAAHPEPSSRDGGTGPGCASNP